MSVVKFIVCGLSLLLVSTAALAFQEQKAGSAPSVDVQQPAPVALEAPTAVVGRPVGTDVRSPGLGKLGSLPKMDFGLELLYGAADGKRQDPLPQRDEQRDDLTVRGTVKHNF